MTVGAPVVHLFRALGQGTILRARQAFGPLATVGIQESLIGQRANPLDSKPTLLPR